MNKKIEDEFLYEGLGFPVLIKNAPMENLRGEWVLDLGMNKFQKVVLLSLATSQNRLTGNQIRFIRNYFNLKLQKFADLFGNTHASVLKWEKSENNPCKMEISTERWLRNYILDQIIINDDEFRSIFKQITNMQLKDKNDPIDVDASKQLIAM